MIASRPLPRIAPSCRFAAMLSLFAFLTGLMPTLAGATPKPVGIDLPVRSFTLENGLRVTVLEDHSTPAFALRTVFDVGARDEEPGRTGFAHLFEHMLFKGSENVPDGGHSNNVEGVGGHSNASTSWDRTDYWNELPSQYLDRILWLEADRLRTLAVTARNFVNQRDAVKEEMARYFNRPYAAVIQDFMVEAFAGTPYGHSVFGSVEDLERGGVEEARAFFRRYYTPNNAVMVLVGDVDFAEVKKKVHQYFGAIPRGPARPAPVSVDPKRRTHFTKQVQDPLVPLPLLILGWQTVADDHPDFYPLDLLTTVLLSGDSSRLTRRLKDEEGLALEVDSYNLNLRAAGIMAMLLTPSVGTDFEPLQRVVLGEIEDIQRNGIRSDELEKAINQQLVATLEDLSTNLGRASAIGDGALYYGDPQRALTELQRYQQVSLADIQRVAKAYLGDQRMVMEIVPGGTPNAAMAAVGGRAHSEPVAMELETPLRTYPNPPAAAQPRPVNFPGIRDFPLDNGLDVYVVEDHGAPLVTASLVLNAGALYAEHLPELTANMLLEGTKKQNKAELIETIERIGGSLEADVGIHSGALSTQVLSKDLGYALELLADAIRNPAFPEGALEKLKRQTKAEIKAEKADAGTLADTLFGVKAYPAGHPYGRPFPREEDIDRIKVSTLREFHQRMYQPGNAYLILAGDITPAQARVPVKRAFGDWKPATDKGPLPDPLLRYTDYPRAEGLTVHLVDRKASSQARIMLGNVAIPRNHKDWIPLQLASSLLGADGTGRLFRDLREMRGLAYAIGAYVEPRRAVGAFKVSTGTRPENVGAMLAGIFEHLERMRSSLPATSEFQTEVRQTVGRFPLQIETPEQIAYRVNMIKSYALPWDYYQTYRDAVQRTTPEAIRDAARRYMNEAPLVVIVGPADSIESQVRKTLPDARIVRYDTDLKVVPDSSAPTPGNDQT